MTSFASNLKKKRVNEHCQPPNRNRHVRTTHLKLTPFPLLRINESTFKAMMSLAQAAFYLLRHLFSVHGLAIRKESQVISGIFQLLAKSLQLAKSSFVKSTSSKEADDSCQDIFQRAVQSLLSFLDENFRESLFNVSKDLRQEEFQVRCYVHLLDSSSSSAKFQLPLPYTAPPHSSLCRCSS